MAHHKRAHIAQMLLEKKLVTQVQVDEAFDIQKKSDKKIGQILVDLGYVDELELLNLLSQQLNVPYIDLDNFRFDPNLVRLLPEFYARNFRAIVLRKEPKGYLVGMVDPQNLLALEELERVLKSKTSLALIREEDLLEVLDNIYRRSEEISQFAESLSEELGDEKDLLEDTEDLTEEDIPVVSLIRSIFEDAVQIDASDIHIEPGPNILRIRLRVDGSLQEQIIHEKAVTQPLVQRLKLISGLNIAEKRLPQDGRFSIHVKGKPIDVRISTLPISHGESVVMRLLDQSAELLELKQIHMPPDLLEYYSHVLTMAYGLLLIVGPTGSGKTTTLYASLNELNSPEEKIITVEDPVEYRIPRINQVQVNSKIGLTFANVLRSILRQDPDIVMIGELRDTETVDISLRAAMTGHFVLATLHTNDTISSVTRLIDMDAEGFIIASVLRAVVAQRLVRKICEKCTTKAKLTSEEKRWLLSQSNIKSDGWNLQRGKGCTYCHKTGYQGRIGVFELLPITIEMANAIRQNNIELFTKLANEQPLYRPLVNTALELVKDGKTTVEEVINMAGEV